MVAAIEPRAVIALVGAVMGLFGPGLYAMVVNKYSEFSALWRVLRLLVLYSAVGLSLIGLGVGWIDLYTLITAVLVLLLVLSLIHVVLEKRSQVMVIGLGDEVIYARLLPGQGAAAFSFTGTGRIYLSEGLVYALEPGEIAAIVAHERGHTVSLKPFSPLITNSVLALLSVAIVMGSLSLLATGHLVNICIGLFSVLGAWGLWVTYNWAWESLADLYSVARTGIAAYTALQRITGSGPEPLTPRKAYKEFLRSLRPRRIKGGVFLVNPHPSPETRLYIIARVLSNSYSSYLSS